MSYEFVVQETPVERVRCFCTIERGGVTTRAWTNRDYWWYQLTIEGPGAREWSGVALMEKMDLTGKSTCCVCVRDAATGTVVSLTGGTDMHRALVVLTELLDRQGRGERIEGVWPRPLTSAAAEV